MNMFSKGNASRQSSKKPVVRRETIHVPVKPASAKSHSASVDSSQRPNRFQLSDAARSPKTVESRALAPSRGLKRKQSATPQPMFSDDEADESSSDIGASDSDASRKRIKSSVSSVDELGGAKRCIKCHAAFHGNPKDLSFIHGAAATSGNQAGIYKNPWGDTSFSTIDLRYPSIYNGERFELKWPRNEGDDYKPMEDVIETIKHVVQYYFPEHRSRAYLDDSSGFARRFNRAWQRQDIGEFIEIVAEYNATLASLIEDGTIENELERTHSLHLDWVRRILDQIYSRTVSPKVETLRAYQNGSDNVYGELFPRFISDIFQRTKLHHQQVFIDLGSGVGNVVLQAALEIGCESWGIEMMKNPCELAALQAKEFGARTKLWGLSAGSVHLMDGDMTEHPDVPPILQRADVVLVNNQAFTPQLNDKLCTLFLDLKPGAQVVSLKPFVPEGHKMALRNIDSVVNQFVQRKYEYFSDSVSWSYYGNAHWYIATKDLRPLNAFRRRMGLDKS